MQNLKELCFAIQDKNITQLKDHLETIESLTLIPTSIETVITDYNPEKKGYTRKTVNFLGKSFFHLVAFTSSLEILMILQPKLNIPIIPVNKQTLKNNNPFQFLWDHGKTSLLYYCMSLCEEIDLNEVFTRMAIDVKKNYGNCLKYPAKKTFDHDKYEQQKKWVLEKNWQLVCDAIETDDWLYSTHQLIQNEANGLKEHINLHCSKAFEIKYEQLKNLALHEKNAQISIKKKNEPAQENLGQSPTKIRQASMFTQKNMGTICMLAISICFFCRYYFSNNTDDSHTNLENGPR